MYREVEIPVLPHVRKYLDNKYPRGFVLTHNDPAGVLLFNLLRRPLTDNQLDKYLPRYSRLFKFQISEANIHNRRCVNFNSFLTVKFNSFVEGQIKEKMYDFVDNRKYFGFKTVASAIREFMKRNGFEEDDINYETLKKAYNRHENRFSLPQAVEPDWAVA